eukprot:scaffold1790_cov257-Pinguiococcus_pyrenoidosus.AAC.33
MPRPSTAVQSTLQMTERKQGSVLLCQRIVLEGLLREEVQVLLRLLGVRDHDFHSFSALRQVARSRSPISLAKLLQKLRRQSLPLLNKRAAPFHRCSSGSNGAGTALPVAARSLLGRIALGGPRTFDGLGFCLLLTHSTV